MCLIGCHFWKPRLSNLKLLLFVNNSYFTWFKVCKRWMMLQRFLYWFHHEGEPNGEEVKIDNHRTNAIGNGQANWTGQEMRLNLCMPMQMQSMQTWKGEGTLRCNYHGNVFHRKGHDVWVCAMVMCNAITTWKLSHVDMSLQFFFKVLAIQPII